MPPRLTRRRFLGMAAGSIAAGAGTCLYTWRVEPHWLEVVTRALPIRHLPATLVGKRLVQLSDIHVGERVDDAYVIETFERVTTLDPDIVVLTGDLASYHRHLLPQLRAVYRHFPKGRLATLAILGNHDYGPNWSHAEVADAIVATVAPFGIRVLRNEITQVSGLQVVGLDDWWARRFEPLPVLQRLDRARASLVLSHNPDTVDMPGWDGYDGWILSGHTHGGQCKPPFLRPPLLPVQNRRYVAGEFELSGNRKLYINRGVGHLLQVRFNVRPEVTVFELSRVA